MKLTDWAEILKAWNPTPEGDALHRVISDLFPLCRSITGNGLRRSLEYLKRFAPVSLQEVPSGTQIFDWTVPKEWNIRDAWIRDSTGRTIIDFQNSNLHVVSYSVPIRKLMPLSELKQHLFSLPEQPDSIPYRTSYYRESWGFCLSQHQLEAMTDGMYEVCVDSTLEPGHLTYGEYLKKGERDDEILISCHSCHPSLCNDNLSGMAVTARLAQLLTSVPTRYSYRFVWCPATIGSIAWLARNEATLSRIKSGLVVSSVGDSGSFTYKRSRHGDAPINGIVEHVLGHSGQPFDVQDFSPLGYDERQYCSPGIDLPVGCFMRTPNGKYPQYHTSADNLDFVSPSALSESLRQLVAIVAALEVNRHYENLKPRCEPQLGRRGLYQAMGGTPSRKSEEALLWVLNFSDSRNSLLDIAVRSKLAIHDLAAAARELESAQLLRALD